MTYRDAKPAAQEYQSRMKSMCSGAMTVLQVLPSLEAGGAERATVDMAAALSAAGHRALVISSGGPLVETIVSNGAEHISHGMASKNPLSMWNNRNRMIELIRTRQIDLVHARSRAPAWSAFSAARITGVPFVTTFHDAYASGNRIKALYNSVMARGDRVIAISPFVESHIRANYPWASSRVVLIPRGIDFSVFEPDRIDPDRIERFRVVNRLRRQVPLIILPARLSPTKGHELALRAMAKLGGASFHLLIIGPDQGRTAYRERLVHLAQQLGLLDKVNFIQHTDLPAAYAAADLVLSPSQKAEGFGRVPVEAQAMGVPVIATALGATRQTILNGETGWLVPRGDVSALAEAVAVALRLTSEQRSQMASRAKEHVRKHFDARRMCSQTLSLYQDLLQGRDTSA